MLVSYSESQNFLLDTEMRSGFSGRGWESRFGQSSLPLTIMVLFAHALRLLCPHPPFLILEPTPCFMFLPVLLVLDKTGFRLLSSMALPFFIFWREGQKEDEGLKVCEGKFWRTFLDYVHKAQAAHSVNMACCQ